MPDTDGVDDLSSRTDHESEQCRAQMGDEDLPLSYLGSHHSCMVYHISGSSS